MRPQLILLGAPGSGKGTQAHRLVNEYKYNHISTGDLLRAEITKGSELGNVVKSILENGQLVDDDTVLSLLKANCDLGSKSYIFDGFPRNLEQARALELEVLKGANSKAIYFDIDLEILLERIINRRVAKKSGEIYNLVTRPPKVPGKCDVSGEDLIHRDDDFEEVVRKRMEVFSTTIDPVLDFYDKQGTLAIIDASRSADDLFEALLGVIG